MFRFLPGFCLLILGFRAGAQSRSLLGNIVMAQTSDSALQVILVPPRQLADGTFSYPEYWLVHGHDKKQDSILLDLKEPGTCRLSGNTPFAVYEIIKLQSAQITGSGQKEAAITWQYSATISDHGGTFDIEEEKKMQVTEIWDLDKKEKIFSAISSLYFKADRFMAYQSPTRSNQHCSYHYDLTIGEKGQVIISNPEVEQPCTQQPDHPAGTYIYNNGRFTRTDK